MDLDEPSYYPFDIILKLDFVKWCKENYLRDGYQALDHAIFALLEKACQDKKLVQKFVTEFYSTK